MEIDYLQREIAETFEVSRTVVREALIMLELENLITVKKGSGIYVIGLPKNNIVGDFYLIAENDFGPFELLQARQLIESNIASFAASQIVKADIVELRAIFEQEKVTLASNNLDDYSSDEMFHIQIAKATKNTVLVALLNDLWEKRNSSKMWDTLHNRIKDHSYRKIFINDHESILNSLQLKNPEAAKNAMWKHLENVKQILMQVSDNESPDFDGYLFDSIPIETGKS